MLVHSVPVDQNLSVSRGSGASSTCSSSIQRASCPSSSECLSVRTSCQYLYLGYSLNNPPRKRGEPYCSPLLRRLPIRQVAKVRWFGDVSRNQRRFGLGFITRLHSASRSLIVS